MFSFAGKHVLIVSPDPWGRVRMSKHHYAVALIEAGARVAFLEPFNPSQETLRSEGGVQIVNGFRPMPGLRLWPDGMRKQLARRDAKRLLRRTGPIDVIWSFDNSRLFDLDVYAPAVRIHHCMDANMDFQLCRAVCSAQVNLGVTQEIVDRMNHCLTHHGWEPHAQFMPHGWSQVESDTTVPPSTQKRVFYAGNLTIGYLHWPWLLHLVQSFPDVQFVFAGAHDPSRAKEEFREEVKTGITALKQAPNTRLLGRIPADELPAWYAASDALLVTYDFERFGPQVHNSHKLTEYLASGTPVVATWTQSFAAHSDWFPMAQNGQELEEQLRAALHISPQNDSHREARMAYAQSVRYPLLVERVAKLLSEHV